MKTNTEIRMAAVAVFKQAVTAAWNQRHTGTSGFEMTTEQINERLMKAVKWCKENNEYADFRYACVNHARKGGPDMLVIANKVLENI